MTRIKDRRLKMDTTVLTSFTWSYSRLSAFETCARRYHETQVKKAWPEEKSANLIWGDEVHDAMAIALKTNTPLPTSFKIHQHWVDKVRRTPGELLVEENCRWACTRRFEPTTLSGDGSIT